MMDLLLALFQSGKHIWQHIIHLLKNQGINKTQRTSLYCQEFPFYKEQIGKYSDYKTKVVLLEYLFLFIAIIQH